MKNRLNGNNKLKREIGLFSATILVIANMVGTGIFTTSGFIMAELGSPKIMLICWLCGGLFALCGALCYGELGSRFPRAGGEYVFLRESFGRPMAFLSGWISLVVGFSAPIAAAAIAMIMVITTSFNTLLIYIGFTLALFAMLTVIGLIKIRRTRPPQKDGYRTLGYPATPLIFILGNAWIIFFSLKSRPLASLFGLGTIGIGILIYLYFAGRIKTRASAIRGTGKGKSISRSAGRNHD
jgi:amino acid transporter